MEITLNGKKCSIPAMFSLRELLAAQSMQPSHVVVEINRSIIPKDRYDAIGLNPDDHIEILSFVGGGRIG